MRTVTLLLLGLLAIIHAELWFGKGGVPRVRELRAKLAVQDKENAAATARNMQLKAEVLDLKEGLAMVEEKARFELGMLKPNEIYVQITQ
jgi:cell division protein FtsB